MRHCTRGVREREENLPAVAGVRWQYVAAWIAATRSGFDRWWTAMTSVAGGPVVMLSLKILTWGAGFLFLKNLNFTRSDTAAARAKERRRWHWTAEREEKLAWIRRSWSMGDGERKRENYTKWPKNQKLFYRSHPKNFTWLFSLVKYSFYPNFKTTGAHISLFFKWSLIIHIPTFY